MKASEFVDTINKIVRQAAVTGTISHLRDPPGMRPLPEVLALSKWYNGLDTNDQAMVERMMDRVARAAVFGFLAVLDGVRQVEGIGPKGHFELRFIKDGRSDLLNDPEVEMLHDLLD
jgi:hypothetical protein